MDALEPYIGWSLHEKDVLYAVGEDKVNIPAYVQRAFAIGEHIKCCMRIVRILRAAKAGLESAEKAKAKVEVEELKKRRAVVAPLIQLLVPAGGTQWEDFKKKQAEHEAELKGCPGKVF